MNVSADICVNSNKDEDNDPNNIWNDKHLISEVQKNNCINNIDVK